MSVSAGGTPNGVMILDIGRPFVLFGDHADLSHEPVNDDDLALIRAPDTELFEFMRSCAWSSDVRFYALALSNGIAIFSVATGGGLFCRKRSAAFFDRFLSHPLPKPGRP